MTERLKNIPELLEMPIVGIIRNMTFEDMEEVLPVYCEAGLRVVEITMNTRDAGKLIEYANAHFGDKLVIGAGTVCSVQEFEEATSAGAKFIVTPVVEKDVITNCVAHDLPVFAGAFTPTEIYTAWKLGAAAVKIFPASSMGVQYVKDVRAPLNNIALMPTGGVDLRNISAYFKAGAVAVGIGGKLFNEAMIREKNWNGLIEHFAAFVKAARPFTITAPLTTVNHNESIS